MFIHILSCSFVFEPLTYVDPVAATLCNSSTDENEKIQCFQLSDFMLATYDLTRDEYVTINTSHVLVSQVTSLPLLAGWNAASLLDSNSSTQYLGALGSFILMQFPSVIFIDSYSIVTGSDNPARDLLSWRFYGSNNDDCGDKESWKLLDSQNISPINSTFLGTREFAMPWFDLNSSEMIVEATTSLTPCVVNHTFLSLDTTKYDYFLDVDVKPLDYFSSHDRSLSIFGNALKIADCDPDSAAVSFFSCLERRDVTALIRRVGGGAFNVTVAATPAVSVLTVALTLHTERSDHSMQSQSQGQSMTAGTTLPPSGVTHTFTHLDTSHFAYFLTVQVWANAFALDSAYVEGIYANGQQVGAICDPGVDGAYFHFCIVSLDVTALVNARDEVTVFSYGTSDINSNKIHGYYLCMRYHMEQRDTLLSDNASSSGLSWTGGSVFPSRGVTHTFTGLDTRLHTYALTVGILPTDYDDADEFIITSISANNEVLVAPCAVNTARGSFFYYCLEGIDATYSVNKEGELTVLTYGTDSSIDSYFTSGGYNLFVSYLLAEGNHTVAEVAPGVWEGGAVLSTTGARHVFTHLDSSLHSYALTVEVWANVSDRRD
jgi:hypothetical protein